jgi:hypothetical protein
MAGIVNSIVDALTKKRKDGLTDADLPPKKPVEEMEDPVGNPDRPLTMGEIHKIGRAKVAKPRY